VSVRARALVTGASRGIGAAVAEALAAMGHPVIVNFKSNEEAAAAVKAKIEAAGGSAELARFDVSDGPASSAAITELLRDERPIGIVVNNAGVAADAPFPNLEEEAWTRVTRTALDGFYHVTRPLVMPMVRRRWGRIINISSVSGVIGNRGQVNYSAAKAGLIGATRSLAQELAKRGVTVNAVAPGLIDTEMLKEAPVDELLKHVPMRRLGKADEVASLVAFLASDAAGYITGQVIGINGGLA
jgi:3-oxoacyl-[acyl-carrier protein] reductase